jgi:hypothetical protein
MDPFMIANRFGIRSAHFPIDVCHAIIAHIYFLPCCRHTFVIGVVDNVEDSSHGDRQYLVHIVYAVLHLGKHVSLRNYMTTSANETRHFENASAPHRYQKGRLAGASRSKKKCRPTPPPVEVGVGATDTWRPS